MMAPIARIGKVLRERKRESEREAEQHHQRVARVQVESPGHARMLAVVGSGCRG